ncbi:MAG: PAS domain-containing protein [Gemmatimonadaceae bacterium]|nr:PAS domain-containing protein [Gemmatimonadaceae bacterium]
MTDARRDDSYRDRFNQIIDSVDVVVWEWDARTRKLDFVNSRVEAMFGFPAEQWQEGVEFWASRIHPGDRDRVIADFNRVARDGGRYKTEYRIFHADGSEKCVEDTITAETDDRGEVVFVRGLTMDVTERRASQEQLEESEERFRLVADVVLDAVFIHENGIIIYMNNTGLALLGYEQEEIVGRSGGMIVAPEDREKAARRIASPGEEPMELKFLRKDGSTFPVEIRGCNGTLRGRTVRIVVARDLSMVNRVRMTEAEIKDLTQALHESQHQLIHSQKLEAIGRVTGGVAHDFNNLLTVIMSYTQILLTDIADSDPRREDVQEIQRAAERATTLTRQLLAFSRKQPVQPHRIDMTEIVQDTEKMVRRLLGERIELSLLPSAEPQFVLADPGQIEQILVNLAVNAADAMPNGGVMTISTGHMEVTDPEYASRHMGVDVPTGVYAVLSVSDTGHGMTEETKSHIFEPFYTTKPKGKGTGLGLATAYGIVKQARGYIWVYSKLGTGTTFKIYLPRA